MRQERIGEGKGREGKGREGGCSAGAGFSAVSGSFLGLIIISRLWRLDLSITRASCRLVALWPRTCPPRLAVFVTAPPQNGRAGLMPLASWCISSALVSVFCRLPVTMNPTKVVSVCLPTSFVVRSRLASQSCRLPVTVNSKVMSVWLPTSFVVHPRLASLVVYLLQ